ncbi:beta-glucosidase [Haloplasma contractile]|uniref:Beta-glucosidase-related glycosidase Carbohydrate transport protein n=1 Tax=Haloplasma contractile SSD-17B TaxID=1033810 RepID=F7PUF3_9MOLU|nr:glycoside hydrolase family 3 C-terminal domain-containing protein [Haloplasma contractile]ERJ11774.1 Beta-glucosidase-related glycosidase Carbohydrate transport protein [Haloplasma contractile SSD-17B]
MGISEIISKMTLEEKASLCSGKDFWRLKEIERLDIPSIMVADGPHGLRKQAGESDHVGINNSLPATCFPTAVTTASSWNTELMNEIGKALGEACLQEGVSVILGPGMNIKRSPLCGRNFEYLSEDPYVTGKMASALINGVQSKGIGTSIKHYAVNTQEKRRMTIDSVVDERALREIYLAGFETAVRESQPWTVMSAYNLVNGTYASEHKTLLTDILRDEWKFEGIVVTDWGACNDRVEGLKTGLDLEMPSSKGVNDQKIIEAVKEGTLSEAVLDRTVERILNLVFKSQENKQAYTYDEKSQHDLAKKAAIESIVLMKNENSILPISHTSSIAVVGDFAKQPRYQGAGSSLIKPTKLDTIYDEFKQRELTFNYSKGYERNNDDPNEALIKEACENAMETDVVLLFIGLTESYESEGFDRDHLRVPESHRVLLERLSEVNENIIVILSGGSPVEMPWLKHAKGLVNSYLAGQAGAPAIAKILFGEVNPSGKLAETYPIQLEDHPSYHYFAKGPLTTEHRESVYVGYRYFDTANKEVLFPFGYGLSYTTFEYSDLTVSEESITDSEPVKVKVTVKNTGQMTGAEVVQLYVSDVESTIYRPVQELKGFKKVYLEPGEDQVVEFELTKRAFAYYNENMNDWHVESGEFTILIGSSSRDIRQRATIYVKSSQPDVNVPDYRETAPTYYKLTDSEFTIEDSEYQAVYGKELPASSYQKGDKFTMTSPLEDVRATFFGRIVYNAAVKELKKMTGGADSNQAHENLQVRMLEAVVKEMPFRSLVTMSNGAVSPAKAKALLKLINCQYIRGLIGLMKVSFKNRKKK